MSLVQPQVPEGRPSPALSLNLSSNNPFRNRAASPQIPSPAIPSPAISSPRSASQRPLSRNPFLTAYEEDQQQQPQVPNFSRSSPTYFPPQPQQMERPSPNKMTYGSSAQELFNELSLSDKPAAPNGASFPRKPLPQRAGTVSARPIGDGSRRMAPPRPRKPAEELDVFASPPKPSSENRRPRRNSESSVMDKSTLDDERRRRERRHRERERREREGRVGKDGKDGKERSGRGDRPPRKPKGLDLIDKLDVTGIYGPSLFHHDGPFDACNPHRNRKKDHRAPMQAFPEGSANNAMGGSGPVNKNINLDRFHGREAEGFNDFGALPPRPGEVDLPPIKKPSSNEPFYNPKQNIEQVHGDFTEGLGTSTFLEGAPASRRDLQRRDSEEEPKGLQGGGLARKKSLAQRIRGISQPRRDYGGREFGGRIQSPESRYEHRAPPPPPGQASPNELRPPPGPQSAGGNLRMYETNPFFDDYDDAYEKKGASIKVAEASSNGRARAPSSPQRPVALSRTRTTGSNGPADFPEPPKTQPSAGGGGLINRMKSLKGGKRPRPERNLS